MVDDIDDTFPSLKTHKGIQSLTQPKYHRSRPMMRIVEEYTILSFVFFVDVAKPEQIALVVVFDASSSRGGGRVGIFGLVLVLAAFVPVVVGILRWCLI